MIIIYLIENKQVLSYNEYVVFCIICNGDYMKKCLYILLPIFVSISLLISSFILPENTNIASSDFVTSSSPIIIIDAGHGGFDGGAVTKDGFPEKDINLNISLYLNEYLTFLGFNTLLTRENDNSLENDGLNTIRSKKTSDLHNRMKIMEETENSIFVSIHQNIYTQEKYSGIQVFFSPKTSAESSILAKNIQETVVHTLQPDNTRQIKECGTSVFLIYNAVRPAVLVECGFLSNYKEAEKLKTEEYQKRMAFCIAIGIQNYIG